MSSTSPDRSSHQPRHREMGVPTGQSIPKRSPTSDPSFFIAEALVEELQNHLAAASNTSVWQGHSIETLANQYQCSPLVIVHSLKLVCRQGYNYSFATLQSPLLWWIDPPTHC